MLLTTYEHLGDGRWLAEATEGEMEEIGDGEEEEALEDDADEIADFICYVESTVILHLGRQDILLLVLGIRVTTYLATNLVCQMLLHLVGEEEARMVTGDILLVVDKNGRLS